MHPTEIVSSKIMQLRRRLIRAEKDQHYAECLKLEGGIFYLEYVYSEIAALQHANKADHSDFCVCGQIKHVGYDKCVDCLGF